MIESSFEFHLQGWMLSVSILDFELVYMARIFQKCGLQNHWKPASPLLACCFLTSLLRASPYLQQELDA